MSNSRNLHHKSQATSSVNFQACTSISTRKRSALSFGGVALPVAEVLEVAAILLPTPAGAVSSLVSVTARIYKMYLHVLQNTQSPPPTPTSSEGPCVPAVPPTPSD
jgi:hypothetical protein